MPVSRITRLCLVLLVLTFGIGLSGQGFARTTKATHMASPSAVSIAAPAARLGCGGGHAVMASGCLVALCVTLAVLPAQAIVSEHLRPLPAAGANQIGAGISSEPDPYPPRFPSLS